MERKKIKIVCDVDDILWDLNAKATAMAGIPMEDIICFHVSENPLLSDEQKRALKSAYGSEELFSNIQWYEGVDKLFSLESKDVEIHINSNCYGANIVEKKRDALHKLFAVSDTRIHLNDLKSGAVKNIGDDVTIFIDDSPYNHIENDAKYHIMMNKPWNTSEQGKEVLGALDDCMLRCIDFNDVMLAIKALIAVELEEDY